MKILRDQAIFSDGEAARRRAITELTRCYGKACTVYILEIISLSLDDCLKEYCWTRLDRIHSSPG